MTADHNAKGCPVTDFDTTDYFTDPSLVPDPHPYFDYLRGKGAGDAESQHGVVAVTGYDEAMALYKDIDSFSSCIAVGGPFPPLPFEPSGDDISDLIDQHRSELPLHEHMVTMDPPDHTRARSVLSRLLTPARLKENQDFLWTLADEQLDEFVERGECEFLAQYSKPYSLLAVANLLGVPEADHKEFRMALADSHTVGNLDHDPAAINPLQFLDEKFSFYIEDRRREPRGDVLSDLAGAKYPDGSTPEVVDVVRTATFLFGAGQETTAKLLGAALQILCDRPDLQQALRDDRSLIPAFIEETLRMESPVKSAFRLGAQVDLSGWRRHPSRYRGDGLARRDQPRSQPFRKPARVPTRPPERSRADSIRTRRAHLPGCAASPGRGPDLAGTHSGPDGRHPGERSRTRAGR